jgi:hypothetical protein
MNPKMMADTKQMRSSVDAVEKQRAASRATTAKLLSALVSELTLDPRMKG